MTIKLSKDVERPQPDHLDGKLLAALWFALLFGFLPLVIIAFKITEITAEVPLHFDFDGSANNWGSRSDFLILLFFLVAIALGILVFVNYPHLLNTPWEPQNLASYQEFYRFGRIFIICMSLYFSMLTCTIELMILGVIDNKILLALNIFGVGALVFSMFKLRKIAKTAV